MISLWRSAIALTAITASCLASSVPTITALRRAADAGTVRPLIQNLSAADVAAVDPNRVCSESPRVQDFWFDALRLLSMEKALRAYARCNSAVNLEIIEATKLPLTAERRRRIERYIDRLQGAPRKSDGVDPIFLTPEEDLPSDSYTSAVLNALEADGSTEALVLCERLGSRLGYRCDTQTMPGPRSFDTPERVVANDPFLALYKASPVAASRDGVRRFYLLEPLKRPHDDTCRRVAVIARNSGQWALERVECETTSAFDN
jgi:hypothetical protein